MVRDTDTSLIGHEQHASFLTQLVQRGTLPVATLLSGPPMIGKLTLAGHIAALLFCATHDRCGTCASCVRSVSAHPDFLSFSPDERADVRDRLAETLSRLHQRPLSGSVRVMVLESVDRYSPAALALLLKGIEDAPFYTRIFLTAATVERVPATIRSRTLVRALQPVPTTLLAGALRERGYAAVDAEHCARLSGGRPGLALRLHEDADLRKQYETWNNAFQGMSRLSLWERSAFAEAHDDREHAEELLSAFQTTLRGAIDEIRVGARAPQGSLLVSARRSREAVAMLHANVPPRLALEYVFFTSGTS